eukprot:2902672-Prymnesium_polylepis.1
MGVYGEDWRECVDEATFTALLQEKPWASLLADKEGRLPIHRAAAGSSPSSKSNAEAAFEALIAFNA